MNVAAPDVITVVPDAMITVTVATPGGNRLIHAIGCRYIPATMPLGASSQRVVGIEIIHDPNVPNPMVPYLCDLRFVEVLVLPANALRNVRPYQPLST